MIGNGPSLKDCPKELLEKYPTFGSNKIFLLPFSPTYYAIIDFDMLHDCTEVIASGIAHVKLDGYADYDLCEFTPGEVFLPKGVPIPGSNQMNVVIHDAFSHDINQFVSMGGTVTYALLQLAFYMGFETVLLVGVDHKYSAANGGKPGSKFLANGEDEDHFHPEYFKEGRVYNRPELEGTSYRYRQADQIYKANGRRIINLTPDTALDAFEKGSYADWL